MTGAELLARRAERGIARRAVALALGVAETTVYRWEHAARRIRPLQERAYLQALDEISGAARRVGV